MKHKLQKQQNTVINHATFCGIVSAGAEEWCNKMT